MLFRFHCGADCAEAPLWALKARLRPPSVGRVRAAGELQHAFVASQGSNHVRSATDGVRAPPRGHSRGVFVCNLRGTPFHTTFMLFTPLCSPKALRTKSSGTLSEPDPRPLTPLRVVSLRVDSYHDSYEGTLAVTGVKGPVEGCIYVSHGLAGCATRQYQ